MIHNYTYFIVENIEEVCIGIEKRMSTFKQWQCIGFTGNIEEAKQKVQDARPRLLFLDWGLNGGSGFEVFATIQSMTNYTPYVIFNTGFQKDNPDIPVQLINTYQADKYLIKPIWEDLRKNLSQYLCEAEQKADNACAKTNHFLKNINNKIENVNLNNLICIMHDKTKPRFKYLYFTDKRLPVIINQNWQYCYTLLKEHHIDFFITNDKNHLVIKQHIIKFEKNIVKFEGTDIVIEVVKEKVKKFEEWLVL